MVAADGRTGFSWSHRRLQLQYRPTRLPKAGHPASVCHSDWKRGRPRAPDVPRHSITRHHQPWTLREPLRALLSSQVALAPSPDLGRAAGGSRGRRRGRCYQSWWRGGQAELGEFGRGLPAAGAAATIGFDYAGAERFGVGWMTWVRMAGLPARLDLAAEPSCRRRAPNAMSLGDPRVIAAVVGVFI